MPHSPHPGIRSAGIRSAAIRSAGVVLTASAVLGAAVLTATGAQAAPPSARVSAALAAVTPAGPLTGSGCTPGTGTSACHLYAVAGSVALPGQASAVPVWKFRDSATVPGAGQLTGTGPVLVVTAGDTVTLTLDNVNVPDAVSLAIPGITGLVDDGQGVAAGGTAKTITFTAGRPGSYLYEAGHTANGVRQVLMGLAGALIVRPADWAGATGVRSDLGGAAVPASTFTDEAVLVLGDLDPAFAAAPLTYDLRAVSATYRTINGKVYPGTDPIPTAKGGTVLLRYVNAGQGNHSMGVYGLRQSVVAANAYPGSGMTLVADQLAPGQTEDVLVPVPDEGNYPVADAGGALDTAGLTSGATTLAFGGMMTLLGTAVTPPATDTVGPASSITLITPNPAKVTQPVTVTASFTDPAGSGAGTGSNAVTAAELLIDGQVSTLAPGAGLPMIVTAGGAPGTAIGTVTLGSAVLGALTQGGHRLYVRAKDSAGNWGAVTSAIVTIATAGAATTAVTVAPAAANGSQNVTVSATGNDSALGGTVDQARFAVDCDPSLAGNTCVPVAMTIATPGATVTAESGALTAAAVAALTEGTHTVYVQTHDSLGFWGPATTAALVADRTGPTASGLAVSPNPANGTQGSTVDATSLQVSGTFTDVATGKPASGVTAAEGLFPALTGAPAVQVPPTALSNGKGFTFVASDGAFSATTETAYGLIPLSQLTAFPDGTYSVWVHARDAAGNWGDWAPVPFTVRRGLFSDGFEAGTLAAWTGGSVPASPAGRLTVTTTAANTGTYGLAITGSAATQATVRTPAITPAATAYHARLSFNPNNLGTYTQGGTARRPTYTGGQTGILTGLSGTAEAFQVQYRRVSPTAAAQVRLYLPSRGTATAWGTLGAATWNSLQVDWTTGSTATVTLTVNGASSTLTSQNTSALTITSVKLGFLDAVQNVAGTAYADAFVSSLTPLA